MAWPTVLPGGSTITSTHYSSVTTAAASWQGQVNANHNDLVEVGTIQCAALLVGGVSVTSSHVFAMTAAVATGTPGVYTLSAAPVSGQIMVFVNGLVQQTAAYAVSGTTLTFVTAAIPEATADVETWL